MSEKEQETRGFGESFTFDDNLNPICPKCGSKNIFIWAGMFVDRYTCNDCGYITHM